MKKRRLEIVTNRESKLERHRYRKKETERYLEKEIIHNFKIKEKIINIKRKGIIEIGRLLKVSS